MLISRRKFIQNIAITTIGAQWFFSCNDAAPSPFKFFTNQEARTLGSICNQIIPEDDLPGAVEAGALDYIDLLLTKKQIQLKAVYRNGLESVENSCVKIYGQKLSEINDDKQITFLELMERNNLDETLWNGMPSNFFQMVRKHTIEGYFSHPRHGGNKHLAGYRLLEYNYVEVQLEYRFMDMNFKDTNNKSE